LKLKKNYRNDNNNNNNNKKWNMQALRIYSDSERANTIEIEFGIELKNAKLLKNTYQFEEN